MVWDEWFRPPRRVLTGFLAVVVACLATLAWLGQRLQDQDRALEDQRVQEHLEHTADLVALALERGLIELEGALDRAPGGVDPPAGTILIVAGHEELESSGDLPLLFHPELRTPREVSNNTLREAERLEFQKDDPLAAAALYRKVSRSPEPEVRAAALVRLGRSLRKAGRVQEALDAYSELAALGTTTVLGLPAELVAREARCGALEASGKPDELQREAVALLRDLESGRWRLTRSSYEFRAGEARRWMDDDATAPPQLEAWGVSSAVATLVEEWRGRPVSSTGRRVDLVDAQPVLVAWRATPDRLAAVVAGRGYLTSLWRGAAADRGVRLALSGPEDRTVFGTLPGPSDRVSVRTAAVTKLPWTIHVSSADLAAGAAGVAARRRLLLAGLSVLAVLLVVSSHMIVRAMTRELAVARLQSDFVASVSHEFRSPLTSIRQLSSLLGQGRLASADQLQRAYAFLAAESERLERLIVALLDFGQIEAGRARYRMEGTDAAELVRGVVEAFQRTVSAEGCRVELALPASPCRIRADREALGRALWNLLDNAVKYSPVHRTVWVQVAQVGDRLSISVRDRGTGIPPSEQKAIFGRFFRGARSRETGVKGTGIGLAIVEHVVAAHGGEVRLESNPGEGSRFTLLIPLEHEP
jgi:signal transduction histidine kinase